MTTWEIDVEVRVRKTLCLAGPATEDAVRKIIEGAMEEDGLGLWIFQKKVSDGMAYPMPVPVETVIDNQPTITQIRAVKEE